MLHVGGRVEVVNTTVDAAGRREGGGDGAGEGSQVFLAFFVFTLLAHLWRGAGADWRGGRCGSRRVDGGDCRRFWEVISRCYSS